MIIAIRALVNHQLIVDSIDIVKNETYITKEKTDYTNNFLTPYLKSEFAPYFFAHENNQIFPWEKIISIIHVDNKITTNTTTWIVLSWNNIIPTWNNNPKARNSYIWNLIQNIEIWHKSLPFIK